MRRSIVGSHLSTFDARPPCPGKWLKCQRKVFATAVSAGRWCREIPRGRWGICHRRPQRQSCLDAQPPLEVLFAPGMRVAAVRQQRGNPFLLNLA